jgi:hypothetical protein
LDSDRGVCDSIVNNRYEICISALSLRVMRHNDVDFAIELGAKEEWNRGLHDAEYFF